LNCPHHPTPLLKLSASKQIKETLVLVTIFYLPHGMEAQDIGILTLS
jgi:hypothetical protein